MKWPSATIFSSSFRSSARSRKGECSEVGAFGEHADALGRKAVRDHAALHVLRGHEVERTGLLQPLVVMASVVAKDPADIRPVEAGDERRVQARDLADRDELDGRRTEVAVDDVDLAAGYGIGRVEQPERKRLSSIAEPFSARRRTRGCRRASRSAFGHARANLRLHPRGQSTYVTRGARP